MHGVDVEAEIMQALAQEIVVEIDQEIIGSLRTLAGAGTTLNFNSLSGTSIYVGERHAALAIEINRAANRIAARTRRGAGNYVVVSQHLQFYKVHPQTFARTTEGSEAPNKH